MKKIAKNSSLLVIVGIATVLGTVYALALTFGLCCRKKEWSGSRLKIKKSSQMVVIVISKSWIVPF